MPPQTVTQPLILDARTRCGWASERPCLSEKHLDELMALVGERVPIEARGRVRLFMSRIFAQAAEDTVLLHRLRLGASKTSRFGKEPPKLTTALAKELRSLRANSGDRNTLPRPLTEGLRRALMVAQSAKQNLPSPATTARNVDAIVDAALGLRAITPQLQRLLDDLALAAAKGPDRSVQRQMVRGLAALMEDATGECPGRSHVSSERSRSGLGEHGWFHKLCRRVAVLVHGQLPPELRPVRPPLLTGLINQELEALRNEVAARAA